MITPAEQLLSFIDSNILDTSYEDNVVIDRFPNKAIDVTLYNINSEKIVISFRADGSFMSIS
jgi:hypothetical protein